WTLQPGDHLHRITGSARAATPAETPTPPAELIVVTRDLAQFAEAIRLPGLSTFYCEFENPKHYREAVRLFRERPPIAGAPGEAPSLWVAPPRVFKPGEEWILEQVR